MFGLDNKVFLVPALVLFVVLLRPTKYHPGLRRDAWLCLIGAAACVMLAFA